MFSVLIGCEENLQKLIFRQLAKFSISVCGLSSSNLEFSENTTLIEQQLVSYFVQQVTQWRFLAKFSGRSGSSTALQRQPRATSIHTASKPRPTPEQPASAAPSGAHEEGAGAATQTQHRYVHLGWILLFFFHALC
jgi:hypothetical protein